MRRYTKIIKAIKSRDLPVRILADDSGNSCDFPGFREQGMDGCSISMYFYILERVPNAPKNFRMKIASTIARRWAMSSPLKHTRRILKMGIGSMGLCIAVMVVSICILVGFKQEISQKVFGFGSHVIVQPYWTGADGSASLVWDSNFQQVIFSHPQVVSAQAYALKGALVRGEEESYGVFFKGLPPAYDTAFFAGNLKKGKLPSFGIGKLSPDVLVSEFLASNLRLDTGDRLRAYFIHEGQLRPRSFRVCGIYATGLEKFDETYLLGDIGQIQRINGWQAGQADGVDIRIKDPDKREEVAADIAALLPYELSCFPCDMLFPEIFDWLALIDTNVLVLMAIMLIVCLICLISILFILIIERESHAWVLRTMGASDRLIRQIFLRQTLHVLGRGLLCGNAVALSLCALQKYTGLIGLDEHVYYIDKVPVAFPWAAILSTNACVFLAATLLLFFILLGIKRRKKRASLAAA